MTIIANILTIEEIALLRHILSKTKVTGKNYPRIKEEAERKLLSMQSRLVSAEEARRETERRIAAEEMSIYTHPQKARGYASSQLRTKEPPKIFRDEKSVEEMLQDLGL